MNAVRAEHDEVSASILVGDLNIAPLEHDVWSHKQLLKVVSHTPVETESFEAMRKAGDWVDLMRLNVPPEQKIYTWWSYRAQDWAAVRPRPPARPYLVVGKSRRRACRHRHPARGARLGPAVRPRAGHRAVRSRLNACSSAREVRRQLLDAADQRLQILDDAVVQRTPSGIFFEDAAEHLRLSRSTSASVAAAALVSRLVSAISASSPSIAPGPAVPIGNALAVLLAIQADRPLDHDIGGIGLVVLAVKLPVGRQCICSRRRRAGAAVPA